LSIQSFSSERIDALRICPIFLFIHSVWPSVCGWNDVNIRSFTPSILWSSFHHYEVNLESQSLTIKLGSPCNWTTSCKYFQDSSLAVMIVCTGMRCTMLIIWHTTIHR
jgi:hypothetical protein